MTDYSKQQPLYRAAHPADSAEALLREALERLERVLSHPASSAHWDTGPNGGEIAGAMVQARAALQASAPQTRQPAEPHSHTYSTSGAIPPGGSIEWHRQPERAAADGSEPLDVLREAVGRLLAKWDEDGYYVEKEDYDRLRAAYASQTSEGKPSASVDAEVTE